MIEKPVTIILSCLLAGFGFAADIYVSPDGDDQNSGSHSQPVASIAQARELARAFVGNEPVQVIVADGVYYLPEVVTFTVNDSGSALYPVVYRAENAGKAVLSGGSKLKLTWKPFEHGIYQAAIPEGLEIDQLFVNGSLQQMARYPNYDPEVAVFDGYAADAFSAKKIDQWANPKGGFMHAIHGKRWGSYHYLITGKGTDGSLSYEGGWQSGGTEMHPKYRFVENIREELDAPGEWFLDRETRQLFFYPPVGVEVEQAQVEVANLRSLIELRGTPDEPVRFIHFSGFAFQHAKRTFMETKQQMLRSDWRIYRGGAVFFEGAEDCILDHCHFSNLGGNAVFVNNYNRRISVDTCLFEDCGASGVAFVGSYDAVREARNKGDDKVGDTAVDLTPGPLTENYPSECTVENSLMRRLGRVEKQVAGVEISIASRITVRDCSIYEVPRAGIDIGNGRWGGHLIEGCDVFDTVLETGDHGSFNSWGRDRFTMIGLPEDQLSKISLLDNMEPTVIRNSRWRCDHGWDIDLDDGASNYHIYNNLMLSGGLKLREGFHRQAWNNVIVNNGLHPHVWFPESGDVFTRNIVMGPHRPARMCEGQWGWKVDSNLFTSNEADRSAYLAHGADGHSLMADAQFVDPESGDFRVKEGSPAFQIGFENFPMDSFGVRDPQLKSMARTPDIPRLRNQLSDPEATVYAWLGGSIRDLEGEEYSAWGISSEAGGILVLFAPGYKTAGEVGLQDGDLIYACNGVGVKGVEELIKAISEAPDDETLSIQLRREGSHKVEIDFHELPSVPERQ